MTLNVLYLNPTAGISGAEHSLLALLENLDSRDIRPFLALPEDGLLAEKARQRGVPAFIVPEMIRFGESHAIGKIPRMARSLKRIGTIIKDNGIRLVHSNSPRAGFTGGTAARLNRIPSVIHVRDIHLSPFADPLKAVMLDFLSDAVVTVSRATRASVIAGKRSLKNKTVVVYNGLDFAKMETVPPADPGKEFGLREACPCLASVGIIHPAKGYHTAVKACALLKPYFPGLKWLIIGDCFSEEDGRYLESLKAMVGELDLGGNVVFTGFRNDVLSLMKAADAVVHPAEYEEPFPRCLLEASGLGKPAVASRVGGIPEIIEDGKTGWLVEPGSPRQLADALLHLLRHPDEAGCLGDAARRNARAKFGIDVHADKIAETYREVLGRPA